MLEPLQALVNDRSTLLQNISELGDFQPGSITSAFRRCGSPNCHCAKPKDPGHGPHFQLTQKVDGKTVTQNLPSPADVRKAEIEVAEFRKFQALTSELVGVTVTVEPFTVTSKKWKTWAIELGTGAPPHALPRLFVFDQPMP